MQGEECAYSDSFKFNFCEVKLFLLSYLKFISYTVTRVEKGRNDVDKWLSLNVCIFLSIGVLSGRILLIFTETIILFTLL